MGVTSTGLRYPEGTEPVNAGAQNMQNLAADLTEKYPSKVAAAIFAMQPQDAAVPAAAAVRVIAGQATVTLAGGSAVWAIPNGGRPFTQLLALLTGPVGATTLPSDTSIVNSGTGTPGTVYISGFTAGVRLTAGAIRIQYFATCV